MVSRTKQPDRHPVNLLPREGMMPTSARNTFFGTITSVRETPLLTEVRITDQHDTRLVAVITTESFGRMGLSQGKPVAALVKTTEMLLATDERQGRLSARNCFPGRVTAIRQDGAGAEVMGSLLDSGTAMCAYCTAGTPERLGLRQDAPVWFFFKAFSLILAAE